VQLISAKLQGRNRQSNSNPRKDVAGGSDACLAPLFPSENSQLGWWIDVSFDSCAYSGTRGILNDLGYFPVQNQNIMLNLS